MRAFHVQGQSPRKTPPRREARVQASAVYKEADSGGEEEADEDREYERAAAEQRAQQAQVPAFLVSLDGLDDEVERILAHRCACLHMDASVSVSRTRLGMLR